MQKSVPDGAMDKSAQHIRSLVAASRDIEPLIQRAARSGSQTEGYREALIELRNVIERMDDHAKALLRKSGAACEFQGCYYAAVRMHGTTDGRQIRLCEKHSATSALPVVGGAA